MLKQILFSPPYYSESLIYSIGMISNIKYVSILLYDRNVFGMQNYRAGGKSHLVKHNKFSRILEKIDRFIGMRSGSAFLSLK